MRVRAFAVGALLALVSVSTGAGPIVFFDDFNRPDGSLGNGWVASPNDSGGSFALQNQAATGVGSDGWVGFSRSIDYTAPVVVSGTLQAPSFSVDVLGNPERTGSASSITFFGDGSVPTSVGNIPGVVVQFNNGYNASAALWENGTLLQSINVAGVTSPNYTVRLDPLTGAISGTLGGTNFGLNYNPATLLNKTNLITFGSELASQIINVKTGLPFPQLAPTIDDIRIAYGTAPPLIPFNPITVPLPNVSHFLASGAPTLAFNGTEFTIDFPIFVESEVSWSSISSLVSDWMRAINSVWSRFAAKDRSGGEYPFEFNAHKVDDQSSAFATIDLAGLVGSDNPPCRSGNSLDVQGLSFSCLIPQVDFGTGIMEMYTGAQHFCYDSHDFLRSCDASDVASFKSAFPLMHCQTIYGTESSLMCLDTGGWQTYTAAHEFGHLIGLPDEYEGGGGDQTIFGICQYRSKTDPQHGCRSGYVVGTMGTSSYQVQDRYFEYLFSSLADFTPGHSWTFGPSPTWVEEYPVNSDVATLMAFELPPTNTSVVPEPMTIALLGLGLSVLAINRRKQGETNGFNQFLPELLATLSQPHGEANIA